MNSLSGFDDIYWAPCVPHGKRRWKGLYENIRTSAGTTFEGLVGWIHEDGTDCLLSDWSISMVTAAS
jgi:hypothetical protein